MPIPLPRNRPNDDNWREWEEYFRSLEQDSENTQDQLSRLSSASSRINDLENEVAKLSLVKLSLPHIKNLEKKLASLELGKPDLVSGRLSKIEAALKDISSPKDVGLYARLRSHLKSDHNKNVEKINYNNPRLKRLEIGARNQGNYVDFSRVGDLVFVGNSGLCFAGIYAQDAGEDVVIAGTGEGNKVQVTAFDVDGVSNNMTPDHSNDHITVTKAGMYFCCVSIHIDSQAGIAATFGFAAYKNNGATQFANVHGHRDMPAGAGGNSGAMTLSGIIDLVVGDTIELWAWNEDNTQDITVDDVTMSLFQLGGT